MNAKTFPLQTYRFFFFQVEATLLFTEAHVSDEGRYFCNVSLQDHPAFYVSSQSAQLTVNGEEREGWIGSLSRHWDHFFAA